LHFNGTKATLPENISGSVAFLHEPVWRCDTEPGIKKIWPLSCDSERSEEVRSESIAGMTFTEIPWKLLDE
jgi:hypothetical protein